MELRVHKLLVLLLALSCTPSTNCLDADDLLDYVKNQNARNSEYNSDGDRNSNGRNLNLTPARKRLNLTPTGSQGRPNLTPSGEKKRPNLTPSQGSSNAPCITKKGFPGECVSYYLCSEGGTIVEDGTDLLDVRADTCTHYLYVCCHIDQVQSDEDKEDDISDDILHFDAPNITPHAPASPTGSPQQSEYSPMSPGETVPTDKSFSSTLGHTRPPQDLGSTTRQTSSSNQDATNTQSMPDPDIVQQVFQGSRPETCGWSNMAISPHISSNSRPKKVVSSFYGEFPFMIAVLKRSKDNAKTAWSTDNHKNSGVLINYGVVLTAAHRMTGQNADDLKCRAGEYDTQTELEQYAYQERNVQKFVVHEDFFRPSFFNNIALIFLEKPFDKAPNVGIACLSPTFPENTGDCYSMGWGKLKQDSADYALILKKVPLPLVEAPVCQNLLRKNTDLYDYFVLHDSLTCAGGEDSIDTCRGDGGAPLVCSVETNGRDRRFVVVGLVSYSMACGEEGVPGVYTNVPYLYDWVGNQLDLENINKEYDL